jgi:SAM-dependent methyltransferase
MLRSDEENLGLVTSIDSVDAINSKFYGRFQYPWVPKAFDSPTDPQFETLMLNQSIGDWSHSTVPAGPKIWVAGCGTNQGVFTALRFPQASILGADLSFESLERTATTARQLGVQNLQLKRESINHSAYQEEFDYVICTGVIHHNADPKTALSKLAGALKPGGIMELMVYNRYHRIRTTAFQKAIRIFGAQNSAVDFESEMAITKGIIRGIKVQNFMAQFLDTFKDSPESKLADALLQPVEYSYTIESFEALSASCGLELVAPCINQFDSISGSFLWHMEFADPALQNLYDSLPDSLRWQVSNHLLLEQSPMLWFYLQRSDSRRPRKTEKQLYEEFLSKTFAKSSVRKKTYIQTENGDYAQSPRLASYPGLHPDLLCRKIIEAVAAQPGAPMRDILEQLKIETGFSVVNKLRQYLTTSAFPFLVATSF